MFTARAGFLTDSHRARVGIERSGTAAGQAMKWVIRVLVAALVVMGLAVSVGHYLGRPYNEGFATMPGLVALHIVPGAAYLAIAPLQFVRRFRAGSAVIHRWNGRIAASFAIITGLTAIVLGVAIPYGGALESAVVAVFGAYFLGCITLGVYRARRGEITRHREWMLRAFAIGLAIATVRLVYVPIVITLGDPADEVLEMLFALTFLFAFTSHALVIEAWLRIGRGTGAAPGAAGPPAGI